MERRSLVALISGVAGSFHELWRTWRRLPMALWLLIAARGVNQLGAFTLSFVTVLLAERLHVAFTTAGVLVALFGIATIPGRILGGRLADRIGRRPTIVLGLLATAAAQLSLIAASSVPQAAACLFGLGLAFEIYEPPSQALIADLAGPQDTSIAYGAYSAVLAAAAIIAGVIAALVGRVGLGWLFVVDAGTCLACAALVAAFVREPPATAEPPASGEAGPAARGGSPWRSPRLVLMLCSGTVFAVVYMQIPVLVPLTLADRGIAPSDFGLLSVVSAATIVVGQPLLSRRAGARADSFKALAFSYAALAVGLLWYGMAGSLAVFVVATVVWSLGDLVAQGRGTAVVAEIAPVRERGRYLAAYGVSWGIAVVLAPVVGTQLLDRWGVRTAWAVIGIACALLALAQPFIGRFLASGRADLSFAPAATPEVSPAEKDRSQMAGRPA